MAKVTGVDRPSAAAEEMRRHWPALLGSLIGVAVGAAALPFYTAGVFVTSLQHAFGWSREQLSLAAFAGTLTVALAAPAAGALIDRAGVRFPASVGMVGLAAGFFALSRMNGGFGAYLAIQVATFALAVPSTPIGFTRAINERFDAARGLALGIVLSGTGLAAAIAPPVVAAIIKAQGWRSAYQHLSVTVLLAVPVVAGLLSLRSPARPPAPTRSSKRAVAPAVAGLWRDRRFLRLALVFFTLALGVSGFVLHLVPMLTDAGMTPAAAAAVQARLGIAVIVGRLLVGILADHFFAPRVAALFLSATAAGLVALALGGPAAAPAAAFAIGFAIGAEVDLIGYLTARYFGLAIYGRIYGLLYGAFVLGTGLSPILIAKLVSRAGDYGQALAISAGLVGLAAALLATAPRFSDAAAGPA